ncbi:unnamed protein product, partial [marine sediment metagenome]
PRSAGVEFRRIDDRDYVRGLVHCGSGWKDPVCGHQISIQRAKDIQAVIDPHRKAGGDVVLGTFTLAHNQGDPLAPMLKTISKAFHLTTSGRAWKKVSDLVGARIGVVGWVRSAEITVGENGWHPHLHVLFFIDRILTEDEMKALEQFFYERWSDAIEAAGYGRPSREHGVRVSHGESAGKYVALLSKQNLALETVSSGTKQGRQGNRSTLQLQYDWMVHQRDSDKQLIKEYQLATYRMNQLTWSRGKNDLRKKYRVAEQLDFDLVQDPIENTG